MRTPKQPLGFLTKLRTCAQGKTYSCPKQGFAVEISLKSGLARRLSILECSKERRKKPKNRKYACFATEKELNAYLKAFPFEFWMYNTQEEKKAHAIGMLHGLLYLLEEDSACWF